jgi:putative proteasome-type protease
MTYCVALNLDGGMVFASDSRTNAGVDHVSTFRKMHVFEQAGDRVLVGLCSGNLSLTQSSLNLLEQNARRGRSPSLLTAKSMYEVAALVGDALREVKGRDGPYLMQDNIDPSASFLVGGQIAGEQPRLFHVYSEGNFIEATPETPYFQIGELKYGKPVLDRVVKHDTNLLDAAKCVLVSFDSTMRSNISVGMPIDLICYETNSLKIGVRRRIVEGDEYFSMLHAQWGEGLRRVFAELPNPHWAA